MSRRRFWVRVAVLLAVALVVSVSRVDWFPQLGTYGVSAGSSTVYCSAEVHAWHVDVGCQAGN